MMRTTTRRLRCSVPLQFAPEMNQRLKCQLLDLQGMQGTVVAPLGQKFYQKYLLFCHFWGCILFLGRMVEKWSSEAANQVSGKVKVKGHVGLRHLVQLISQECFALEASYLVGRQSNPFKKFQIRLVSAVMLSLNLSVRLLYPDGYNMFLSNRFKTQYPCSQ